MLTPEQLEAIARNVSTRRIAEAKAKADTAMWVREESSECYEVLVHQLVGVTGLPARVVKKGLAEAVRRGHSGLRHRHVAAPRF